MIDYRSDTFTKPSPRMLEAMFRAKVGDDVFGEDPTVNELEGLCCGAVWNGSCYILPKRHYDKSNSNKMPHTAR